MTQVDMAKDKKFGMNDTLPHVLTRNFCGMGGRALVGGGAGGGPFTNMCGMLLRFIKLDLVGVFSSPMKLLPLALGGLEPLWPLPRMDS